MELCLDHVKEEVTGIVIVLIFILGFVAVVLLIEVVLWRVSVVLFSNSRQICPVASFDIDIIVRSLHRRIVPILRSCIYTP
jgi:hypothetical protein